MSEAWSKGEWKDAIIAIASGIIWEDRLYAYTVVLASPRQTVTYQGFNLASPSKLLSTAKPEPPALPVFGTPTAPARL